MNHKIVRYLDTTTNVSGYGIVEGCGAEIAGAMLVSVDHNQVGDFIAGLDSNKLLYLS